MTTKNKQFFSILNENSIVNLLAYGPFIFIPSAVLILSFLMISASNESFDRNIKKVEQNLYNSRNKTLKTQVEFMVNHISYHKSITKDDMKNRVQKRVENAISIAHSLEKKYRNIKTQKEIQEIIIEVLRSMTWNYGESFIWIMDFNGVFYLAPEYLRHLEGTSIIDFKDSSGNEIIKEEIKICSNEGEGFLWDTFTRPSRNSDKQFHQLAFVKKFGLYDWYMGSSEYLDTATKRSDEVLLTSISKIDAMNSNYFYIVNRDGTLLLHSELPQLVGKNLKKLESGAAKRTFLMIEKALKNTKDGYITYNWYNSQTKQEEKKYTYLKEVPSSDWVVATGYYESSVQNELAKNSKELYETHNMKLTNLIYGSIFILLVSLVISYFVSRFIRKSFENYQVQITTKAKELKILNNSLESKVKQRTEQLFQATKDLEKIAKTDYLTKAHSRYSIMEILKHEIHRCNRHKTMLSVAMVDIDWFKNVNDVYGHDKGDFVLVEVVKLFMFNLRDIDYIGRYGGEEFLLLMPDTKKDGAKITIERMMKNISEHDFGLKTPLTISVGLVEYEDDESIDILLKRADTLLYESKENGRNLLTIE
ncbi:MAG: cache domain-containing protein [Thiovulaceae bacterium]|nr:cache domain-containing protein [Sulfurimonadaceae bacterium]